MAPSIEDLAKKVDGLSLDALADKYPACHPEINPLDLYRAHLANILEPITGVDPELIYTNLQWTSSLDKGDLALPTASLRLKGAKYDQLAKEWAEKVPLLSPALLRMRVLTAMPSLVPRKRRHLRKTRRQRHPHELLLQERAPR